MTANAADRWEVGSEFELATLPDGPRLPLPSPRVPFALAQHALLAVLRTSAGATGVLWVPDYFCPPVVDVLRGRGIDIRMFEDDPRWAQPRWNTLRPRAGDSVLAVNFFGARDGAPWMQWEAAHHGVTVIEDHSHDPTSTWARTSIANYAVASLRKTLPIADGAIAWSPSALVLPPAPVGPAGEGARLKREAMDLKRRYLAGQAVDKDLYRRIQVDGEERLLRTTDAPISPAAAEVVDGGIPEEWRSRRESNVRRLLAAVADDGRFRPLFADWPPGHCPFNAVFVFRSSEDRETIRRRLIAERVYATIHWADIRTDPRARELSDRILTIPVDHRYGPDDVDRVAAILGSQSRRPVTRARANVPSISVLHASDPAWDNVLAEMPHDVYHTAAYHRVAERWGEGEPRLIVARSGDEIFAWPYLRRAVVSPDRPAAGDVTSVYGYPGPVASLGATDAFIGQAWSAVGSMWSGEGLISAFSRFHPLLGNERLVPARVGIERVGTAVSIDLRLSDVEVAHAYPRVLRQEIQRGRAAGLRTDEDPDWSSVSTFVDLYHETMIRNRADSTYFFSADRLRDLRSELSDHARLFVTRVDSVIVAAGIFLVHGGFAHAHLVGTSGQFRALSPLKVLLDDVRSRAADLGAVRLNLGGGRGGRDDSLMAFKARFSPDRHPFAVGRWILDEASYDQLCHDRFGPSGIPDGADYFPAYRTPAGLAADPG